MLLQAAGLGWFALVAGPRLRYTAMVAPLLLAGIGISMALPTGCVGAVRDRQRRGMAHLPRGGGAYQLYRITAVHFSVGLTALTVFDVVLV